MRQLERHDRDLIYSTIQDNWEDDDADDVDAKPTANVVPPVTISDKAAEELTEKLEKLEVQ